MIWILLIVRLIKQAECPRCRSFKVVKNGKKKTGAQNILCKGCGLQFQGEYVYWGAAHEKKALLKRMLLRGSGIRDCSVVLASVRAAC